MPWRHWPFFYTPTLPHRTLAHRGSSSTNVNTPCVLHWLKVSVLALPRALNYEVGSQVATSNLVWTETEYPSNSFTKTCQATAEFQAALTNFQTISHC